MSTPNIELQDILVQAEETLTSIAAVKGEKYAESVRCALSASSVAFMLSMCLAGKLPPQIGQPMLLVLVSQYVETVCEKNGTPWDAEMEGWVDRIRANTDNLAKLMTEAGKPLQ